MFKRFQLPPIKGTEVFPVTIQAPPVVRIEVIYLKPVPTGVDIAQVAIDILNRNMATVGNFITAQRQAYHAGITTYQRTALKLEGIEATYTNNFGTEVVFVNVFPEAVKEEEDKGLFLLVLYRDNRIAAIPMTDLDGLDTENPTFTVSYSSVSQDNSWPNRAARNTDDEIIYPQHQVWQARPIEDVTLVCSTIYFENGQIRYSDENFQLYLVEELTKSVTPAAQTNSYAFFDEPMFNYNESFTRIYTQRDNFDVAQDPVTGARTISFSTTMPFETLAGHITPDGSRYYGINYRGAGNALIVEGALWSQIGYVHGWTYTEQPQAAIRYDAMPPDAEDDYQLRVENAADSYLESGSGSATSMAYVVYEASGSSYSMYFVHADAIYGPSLSGVSPRTVLRQENGLDRFEVVLLPVATSWSYISSPNVASMNYQGITWGGTGLSNAAIIVQTLAIYPFMPSRSEAADDLWYYVATYQGSNNERVVTPYEAISMFEDDIQNTPDGLGLRSWMHLSNGTHVMHGYLAKTRFDSTITVTLGPGSYDVTRLWLNGVNISDALPAALPVADGEEPVTIEEVNLILMDIPLSFIKSLT